MSADDSKHQSPSLNSQVSGAEMLISDLLRTIGGRLDEDLPPAALRALGVDPSEYRADLSSRGLRHAGDGGIFTIEELDRSADETIATSVRSAGIVGAAGGLAGWLGVPPEAAARVVQSVRLAQRIAIIYGHDPLSDRGQAHTHKARAAAWDFQLPDQTNAELRLSDLPGMFQARAQTTIHDPAFMLTTISSAAVSTTSRRIIRLVPGLGATLGLLGARRTARAQGAVMKRMLRAVHCRTTPELFEDAVVVSD